MIRQSLSNLGKITLITVCFLSVSLLIVFSMVFTSISGYGFCEGIISINVPNHYEFGRVYVVRVNMLDSYCNDFHNVCKYHMIKWSNDYEKIKAKIF